MPLSVTLTGYPWWVAGTNVLTDAGGRLHDVSAMTYAGDTRGGVMVNEATPLVVAASSGMNITVAKGAAVIPSASGATDGAYRVQNSASQTLTVAASDPTNPRIDIVVVQILATSPPTGAVSIITGTAAPSPSAPATPSNAILLAQIAVAAGVSSIVAGNISDRRLFTTAAGGIYPVAAASAPAGYAGMYIHDYTTDSLRQNAGGGVVQAHVLPFTPVISVVTVGPTLPSTGATVTIATASITTDGSTDIEIYAKWTAITSSGGNGVAILGVFIDGAQLDAVYGVPTNGGTFQGGGSFSYFTSSAQGTTPSAGAHSITFRGTVAGGGVTMTMPAASYEPIVLRVKPVTL